jgi:hypothetical protein
LHGKKGASDEIMCQEMAQRAIAKNCFSMLEVVSKETELKMNRQSSLRPASMTGIRDM